MKQLKIEIPEGYEIDKEKSTFENIVFKEVDKGVKTWSDVKNIKGYYITAYSEIHDLEVTTKASPNSLKNTFPTKQDAESSLALAQLLQVRKAYIGDWIPDWTNERKKYIISRYENRISTDYCFNYYKDLSFPTAEMRNEFLKHNESLIKAYLKL